MKKTVLAAAAVAVSSGTAFAGGIDRSGQGLGALFEKGRYLELSLGSVNPTVSGMDRTPLAPPLLPGPQPTGNVTNDYMQLGLSYKMDVNDRLSFALNMDQPFGADVAYGPTSPMLGGTTAKATTHAVTALLRYKLNESFSVFGGLRAQRASAAVSLRGLSYGAPAPAGLGSYDLTLRSDMAAGYVVGVAYEKPEIAMRVALSYNSAIKHNFETVENGLPGLLAGLNGVVTRTEVKLPQSVNLDFQSGVAKNTLVFGQIRWADWSSFKLKPTGFVQVPGQADGLIGLEDTITYTLGVGRKFNDNWSGAFSVSYEKKDDPLVSPLAPTNGRIGATLAAVYTRDNMKITTGINYTKLGAAQPATAGAARADTSGKAIGFGMKVGFTF